MSEYGPYEAQNLEDTLVPALCATCGIVFGMLRSFIAVRKKTGDTLYCPNGHGNSYTKDK